MLDNQNIEMENIKKKKTQKKKITQIKQTNKQPPQKKIQNKKSLKMIMVMFQYKIFDIILEWYFVKKQNKNYVCIYKDH